MSLKEAHSIHGSTPGLPKGPPYKCRELEDWQGICFWMNPTDERLISLFKGEDLGTEHSLALDNLEGMRHYWNEHPEWMEMLDPNSPVYDDKILERQLYMHFWGPYIGPQSRILDLGCGVGRMSQHFLEMGCEVEMLDPDLRSLWRALQMGISLNGKLDIHWATGEKMPPIAKVDTVVACEVFNYVEDPKAIIENILSILKEKGILLMSVEARWGWVFSRDVAEGSIDAFLGDGTVHVEKDRWIRTYTKEDIQELLQDFHIVKIQPSHYAFSGPFEMATGVVDFQRALELEDLLRHHPIAKDLNRAWMVVAQKK